MPSDAESTEKRQQLAEFGYGMKIGYLTGAAFILGLLIGVFVI